MKKTDFAYLAGIIDGEGCINLLCRKGKSVTAQVMVINTNEWLIQWLKMSFGGSVYLKKDSRGEGKWKPVYHWVVNSTSALEFLKLTYPYLRLKKPQAEIAIKFIEMRGKKGRKLTEKEQVIGEVQRILMSNLNRKGITDHCRKGGSK